MKLNKVLLSLTLAAIAPGVLAAEPAPVIDISQSSSGGNKSFSLQQRVENLERQVEARNRAQVKVQRQLDELQNEVDELRGVTELHTHQLSQILERQRELYQELDRRVSQALKPANNVPTSIEAPATTASTSSYSSNLTENEAYDRAVNLVLKEKRYDQAIPAFRTFNQNYPNSTYAANAHYWLGQLLFNKNELTQAKAEFERVVANYSQSTKRSDAMFKLALVEQKQGNSAKARSLYQQVIKEYPNSSAAKLAEPRLASLL
ncbi:tol-pal system protein YbgF [Thalassotalea insulae]|uniref:Cell division coordinator CpoB n=1 Tax=Thalassotalea insulae TaxID=2056778 RepID=A0ABQ6GML3_9GAMM|nr:tol-pal system protein YbgF [Thalassotalea insulae]GLX77235.1 tol-pal system protein YbgF [Thalassotalea insulae]